MDDGQDNGHLHLINNHFFQDDQNATIQAIPLMTPDRFHSPDAITSVDLTPWDHMSDVTTRRTTDGLD